MRKGKCISPSLKIRDTRGSDSEVSAARTAHCAGIPCGILHGKHPERIFSFLTHDETATCLRSFLRTEIDSSKEVVNKSGILFRIRFNEASTHSGRSPPESDSLSDMEHMEPEPEGTLFAADEGEQLSEAERWILSLPVVGDVDLSGSQTRSDLREFVLDTVAGALGSLKSLSGTAHHGGVRVFHHNVEIARTRVSFDEEGACSLPSFIAEESVVLTPVAEHHTT